MTYETVATRTSEECHCAEHDIMLVHISATVHIEPDGTGDAFVCFGDWQEEWHFDDVKDIEDLKKQTWERFAALPVI